MKYVVFCVWLFYSEWYFWIINIKGSVVTSFSFCSSFPFINMQGLSVHLLMGEHWPFSGSGLIWISMLWIIMSKYPRLKLLGRKLSVHISLPLTSSKSLVDFSISSCNSVILHCLYSESMLEGYWYRIVINSWWIVPFIIE